MSRGIKDLRELVCLSRLSVHNDIESIDQKSGIVERELEVVTPAHWIDGPADKDTQNCSSSSGIDDNSTSNVTDSDKNSNEICRSRKKRSHKNKRRKYKSAHQSALSEDSESSSSLNSELNSSYLESKREIFDLDIFLSTTNQSMLSSLLQFANKKIDNLSVWCHIGDNFCQFAQFWLADFSYNQRQSFLKMEYNIVLDQLEPIFTSLEEIPTPRASVSNIVKIIFPEYPHKLLNERGAFTFLRYLDILSSGNRNNHNSRKLPPHKMDPLKKLLSGRNLESEGNLINISCDSRDNVQTLLSIRAFTLLSIWGAVIDFFVRVHLQKFDTHPLTRETSVSSLSFQRSQSDDIFTEPRRRLIFAIKNGYTKVVHYILKTLSLSLSTSTQNILDLDEEGRSLLFFAISANSPEPILKYLLYQVKPHIDVNIVAKSGNSVLHVACMSESILAVETLLSCPNIDVNIQNPNNGATPLHVAVMSKNFQIVERLVKKGDCEISLTTHDGTSPLLLAQQIAAGEEIINLLESKQTLPKS